MGYWVAASLAGLSCAGALGAVIHGCGCDDTTAYGVRNGDVVQTTILGPHAPSMDQRPCTGLDAWPPGTTVTWNADVMPSGEGPGCGSASLSGMVLESINGQAVAGSPQAFVDAGSGCVGSLSLGIQAFTSNPSIFDLTPDGGAVTWVLVRRFVPAVTDGGTCPLPPGECGDSFIASSEKL
jgi:hypothetical protein